MLTFPSALPPPLVTPVRPHTDGLQPEPPPNMLTFPSALPPPLVTPVRPHTDGVQPEPPPNVDFSVSPATSLSDTSQTTYRCETDSWYKTHFTLALSLL